MSDGEVTPPVVAEDLEERRATRDMKFWLVKLTAMMFMFIVVSSVLSLIYAAVIQEKDLNTGFIGELFKTIFDFLRFLLS